MATVTRATCSIAIALLAALALVACGGPANERIAVFAQSGAAFARDAPSVYDYAFRTAVDRESADLVAKRALFANDPEEDSSEASGQLGTAFDDQATLFEQRLTYFKLMKRHAGDLEVYFVNLASLAGSDPREQIATAVDGMAGSLVSLVPEIKQVELGGSKLIEKLATVSEIVVGLVANAHLTKHLEEYGDDIDEAIGLQQAMFELLLEIESDRAFAAEKQEIRSALLNMEHDLPTDWSDRRRNLLFFQLHASPISAGRDAAGELRTSFRDLLAGGDGALARLQQAIALAKAVTAVFNNAQ